MSMFKKIKRLTLKFFIDHKELSKNNYSKVSVVNIGVFYGVIKGIKNSIGNSGEVVEFLGSFEAINFLSKEYVKFGACYLPDVLRVELAEHYLRASKPIEVCYLLKSRGADDVKKGYYFIDCEELKPVNDFDELYLVREFSGSMLGGLSVMGGLPEIPVAVLIDKTCKEEEQVDIEDVLAPTVAGAYEGAEDGGEEFAVHANVEKLGVMKKKKNSK